MEQDSIPSPKRKRFRPFRYLLLFLLIVTGGAIVYLWFQRADDEDLLQAIPSDAVFLIETNNLTDGWLTLSSSAQWKHLLSNEYFSFINEDAQWMDSLIRNNKMLSKLMQNRRLLVSAHMLPDNDYDFLFVVDLKTAAKLSFLTDLLIGTLHISNTEVQKRTFEGNDIIEVKDLDDDDVLYLSLVGNRLLCSYEASIIESSIKQLSEDNLASKPQFVALRSSLSRNSLFKFYFNYKMLQPYLQVFFSKPDPNAEMAAKVLQYSGLDVSLKNERIRFEGFTLPDSISSYVKALASVKPGRSRVDAVLSERTALYLSMTFDNYQDFFEEIQMQLRLEDSAYAAAYDKNLNRLRKYFNINVENDFFSWIGNEITYIKMQPSADTKEKDFAVALHADDINLAMEGMDRIVKKVSNRTPWKVSDFNYDGHEIKYFKIKGFFKLFFGKLFEKLEEPYFIYLGDYVVFSNTPSTLIDMIDDFKMGKTLERNATFMDFKSDFNSKANVNIFVRTPKVYSHLHYYANAKNKSGIESNKSLILSYSRIGIQLVSYEGKFRTLIMADHEPEADVTAQVEELETAAEDVFSEEYELLSFKPELNLEELSMDGVVNKYYADSTLMASGLVSDGAMNGVWKVYYPSGNQKGSVLFYNGMVHGIAQFFYDDPQTIRKAEMLYNNDKIQGAYREFFRNGNIKCLLEYRDGLLDGNAEFYYENGTVKIRGKYAQGEKKGKWKFYSETGDVIERETL